MTAPDAIVVGAGVIGCAVARALAREGARVVVVERGEPVGGASHAAAGMLAPQAEAHGPGPFLDLLLASRAMYPELVASLAEETGMGVGYRTEGLLHLALTEEDEAELEERFRWQAGSGLRVERVGAEEARRREPALSPALRMALHFPDDHQVDTRRLGRALWLAAAAAGAEFRLGAGVRRLLASGGGDAGVEMDDGQRLRAGRVVVAAGAWSGSLQGLPRPLPVAPVHGQIVALETAPPLVRHTIASPRGYLVPRAEGRLLAGATMERTGFRRAVTPAGVLHVLSGALEMLPDLAHRPIADLWSGLRPGTPDGLPVLGPDPEYPGIVYATGHHRNGILLAPVTARLVADVVLGREPGVELEPYGVGRFG